MRLSSIILLILTFFSLNVWAFNSEPQPWDYDAGPLIHSEDAETQKMAHELVDLNANIPYFPGISEEIVMDQKFRAPFGPIPWRMLQKPNSVKILFIGQDGTHIAEAAGRPATAGFGGRAHDLANYFGVDYSAAFINTYAFTIYGQYSDYGAPYVVDGKKIQIGSIVDNGVWMMTQSQMSPLTQWRNGLIDWIIRNNKDSLKMIVTFGGSAKDSISSYIISRGQKVEGRTSSEFLKQVKVAKYKMVRAGGNAVFPVPVNKKGEDLYKKYFAEELSKPGKVRFEAYDSKMRKRSACSNSSAFKKFANKYMEKNKSKSREQAYQAYTQSLTAKLVKKRKIPVYSVKFRECDPYDQQRAVQQLFVKNYAKVKKDIVHSRAGLHQSGLVDAAQLGGYDLSKIDINGSNTISLKGLELGKGEVLENDVLVVDLPHPSSLSKMSKDKASFAVRCKLNTKSKECQEDRRYKNFKGETVQDFVKRGWSIEPDHGFGSDFFSGFGYEYKRGDIGQEYYDFGTPGNRMVSKSDAKRLNPRAILLGVREDSYFRGVSKKGSALKKIVDEMLNAKPATYPSKKEMYIAMSRTEEEKTNFDPGPGAYFARLMKENLDLKEIFKEKPGKKVWKTKREKSPADGVEALNVKNFPKVADFGHYRGTFENPEVLILADPQGFDDIITARALTGTRGQYLQGLMQDCGVAEDYLLLKTVPFAMDGATSQEWSTVLEQTQKYRDILLEEVLDMGSVQLILADGVNAVDEIKRFLKSNKKFSKIKVVNIKRSQSKAKYASDMKAASKALGKKVSGKMANIPGSHLSYYARVWEGTSGDRVISAQGKTKGLAFLQIAPKWATDQKVKMVPEVQEKVDAMEVFMCTLKFSDYCQ